MRKSLLSLLLLAMAGLSHATAGPRLKHADPKTQSEFEDVYHAITYPDITNGTAQNLTVTSGTVNSFMVVGTATNDNAPSGRQGEYVSSIASNTDFPASGSLGDLTSISLSPGDWDISAIMAATRNGSTCTEVFMGIGTGSGTSTAGLANGVNNVDMAPMSGSDAYNANGTIANYRVSINTQTPYYFKFLATYSAGTPKAYGTISARRVR